MISSKDIQIIRDVLDNLLHHQEDAAMYHACQEHDKATQSLNNIEKSYGLQYQKGWHEGIMLAKENFITPDLCKKVCDQLLECRGL